MRYQTRRRMSGWSHAFTIASWLAGTTGVHAAPPAPADANEWSIVTDVDFLPHAARVERLDDHAVVYVDPTTAKTVSLPLDRLVSIERGARDAAKDAASAGPKRVGTGPGSGFLFALRDGERLAGVPDEIVGDDLRVRGPGFGGTSPASLPLGAIAMIVSATDPAHAPMALLAAAEASGGDAGGGDATSINQDRLVLTNGDVVTGVLSAADERTLTCQTPGGQSTSVAWSNLRSARLADTALGTAPAAAPAATPAPFRVSFASGEVVDAITLRIDATGATLVSTRGGRIDFGTNNAAGPIAIDHRGGRVRSLVDRPPRERSREPYFPNAASAAPATPTAAGVTIGNHVYRRTLAAPPHSVMTWPLDGSAKRFVTRYGIADGLPLADVTIRVLVDGRPVHERAHVKSGTLSDLVSIPLAGDGRALSLEVDYGDNYDVQDHAYWVEPSLVAE